MRALLRAVRKASHRRRDYSRISSTSGLLRKNVASWSASWRRSRGSTECPRSRPQISMSSSGASTSPLPVDSAPRDRTLSCDDRHVPERLAFALCCRPRCPFSCPERALIRGAPIYEYTPWLAQAHRFDVVAVGIEQKRGVVGRRVIGTHAGSTIVTAAGL